MRATVGINVCIARFVLFRLSHHAQQKTGIIIGCEKSLCCTCHRAFSVAAMPRLGTPPNGLPDRARNADGSYTFADYASLISGKPTDFSVDLQGGVYRGTYRGLVAI